MVNNIFFRRCVEGCDQYGSPACPVCPEGQICSLLAPTCNECQRTVCVAQSAAPSTISSNAKSASLGSHRIGAIAGGVLGGAIAVAAIIYLTWKFFLKKKRQRFPISSWSEETEETLDAEKPYSMKQELRSSMHTMVSTASTAYTRASNVIQIAYIPGVMDRSTPSTPSFLVPPVPPIPLALSSSYPGSPIFEQEHFFMPGDLRDSTYSARTSQTSFDRNSVVSTTYGKSAIISPIPAQTGIRGKAAMVSVRSNPSADSQTMVPSLDYAKYNDAGLPSPAFSVGSTFISHASAARRSRARFVRNSRSMGDDDDSTEIESNSRGSRTMTFLDDNISIDDFQSPIKHGGFYNSLNTRSSIGSLSAVIEDATRKAALCSPSRRPTTPFGDEHEMK